MFINCLWFIEQAWETVFKPFTMKIFFCWVYVAGSTVNHGLQKRKTATSCSQTNSTTSLLVLRTIQCHWHGPLPKPVSSNSPWPTWVKHLNVLTLARLDRYARYATLLISYVYTVFYTTYCILPMPHGRRSSIYLCVHILILSLYIVCMR